MTMRRTTTYRPSSSSSSSSGTKSSSSSSSRLIPVAVTIVTLLLLLGPVLLMGSGPTGGRTLTSFAWAMTTTTTEEEGNPSSTADAPIQSKDDTPRTCGGSNPPQDEEMDDDQEACVVAPQKDETMEEGETGHHPHDPMEEEEDEDETKTPTNEFSVTVINESPYRADVYWDDGKLGTFMTILEANGGSSTLNTLLGHSFVVTRHGTREGLFDLKENRPIKFVATTTTTTIPTMTTKNGNQNNQKQNNHRWIIPKDAAPNPNPCQDRFDVCLDYAAHGSCTTNPGWMIVHCCKACEPYMDTPTLIDPKKRCSKDHLNMTEPIWKPGDLNKLFEEWATSSEYRKYEPVVWSSPTGDAYGLGPDGARRVPKGPWVMTFDQFFTADEARALIRGGKMVGFDRSTDQGAVNAAGEVEKVVSQTRTSSNAWCIGACEHLPQVQAVSNRIESVTHIPRSHYESFQILEYHKDQFYRSHHDSSNRKDDSPSGHRILTFFLYLTDVEEGGATYFNRLKLGIQPRRGRALIWPSVLNEDPEMWDPRMFHEAQDVIRGTKYAANHWIHLNDYVTPNIWGCTGSFS